MSSTTSGAGPAPGDAHSLRWQDPDGRRARGPARLVSLETSTWPACEATFMAENWSGTILVRSGLDGRVVNAGVKRYAA